jgi:hypothetical protein
MTDTCLCNSSNTIDFKKIKNFKDTKICYYCYNIFTKNTSIISNNNYTEEYIKAHNDYFEYFNVQNMNNVIMIGASEKNPYTSKYHYINDFNEKTNLSSYLKYGKFDAFIIQDANTINLKQFFQKYTDYLHDESRIVISFQRINYYTSNLHNKFNYIYNCLAIGKIISKYKLYFDENFYYKDNVYIVSLTKNNKELSNPNYLFKLDKIANEHIIEDYKQNF